VINTPFKKAVKGAFRDYLHAKLREHVQNGGTMENWKIKLTPGTMKNFITGFVLRGISALKTPGMKETIKESFELDGCFGTIRSPERQLVAAEELLREQLASLTVVLEGEEDAEDDTGNGEEDQELLAALPEEQENDFEEEEED
jgi:hypothetical protein